MLAPGQETNMSTRLHYAVHRTVSTRELGSLERTRRENTIRPKISRIDFDLDREREIRSFCWTGRSTGCFRHRLACYPAGAGGYGWHRDNEIVDATPLNPRALTVIVYLNPDWDDDDGGALRFYDDKHSKRPKLGRRGALAVSPEAGTAGVFDSFHGHEVLPSKRRRYALTLWLFHEPLGV